MSVEESVKRYIKRGVLLGLGGFSVSRKCMTVIHEIIRQDIGDLKLCGTNLSIDMDMLVAAGLVNHITCGTGNLERYGLTYNFSRAVERGEVEVEDHSHLGVVMRLTAGELGLPFIPIRTWYGSDILRYSKVAKVIENPFYTGGSGDNKSDFCELEKVIVLPPLIPDVSIVHVQRADEYGNVELLGCRFHDVELMRASEKVIVVAEEIVDNEYFREDSRRCTVPFIHVDAVVDQRHGAYPTGVYGYYEPDESHIMEYQRLSKKGETARYLKEYVYGSNSFDEYLEKVGVK